MVNSPDDLKSFTVNELKQLAYELRWGDQRRLKTGGHLGSSLGVVALTVALHYVFNAPADPIIWDVSHQVYPHKILTGGGTGCTRWKSGGLSGFASARSRSTTNSAPATRRRRSRRRSGWRWGRAAGLERNSIAVIGDGDHRRDGVRGDEQRALNRA